MLHKRKLGMKRTKDILVILLALCFVLFLVAGKMNNELHAAHARGISGEVLDRGGELLLRLPNTKGHYETRGGGSPRLRELTVLKEDRFFYYHLGVNPVSLARSLSSTLFSGLRAGGSTITQQLVKNLLGNENDRTIGNKISELFYSFALELNTPKEAILTMYLESAYFGRQLAGVEGASQYYFGKNTAALQDGEILRLLVLLSAPSAEPGSAGNTARAKNIGERLGVSEIPAYEDIPRGVQEVKKDPALFELAALYPMSACTPSCTLSVDRELTAKIRAIVHDALATKQFASVGNAAVAVIKLGRDDEPNTLLALVGSPDPYGVSGGSQVNMALSPRPIGSTWKPFIYSRAIERGLRPYSLIDDAEYRYEIGTGYAFYPKNYDGIYRGDVTLHYALANSLNIPAVRALEWGGIDEFGIFLEGALGFTPRRAIDTYQLSIALGGLEMNPLLLAHYFTVFPRGGILAPLEVGSGMRAGVPMLTMPAEPERIFRATTTALMNKMLADRLLGVEQFGLESNLNLPFAEYAVKTGTSYDYHDSWTVGYTPDVVVVVWIGNSDNKPMDLVTGARGAGKIWNEVMTLLLAEGDIAPKAFDPRGVVDVSTAEGRSFGLPDDDPPHARLIMKESSIVLEPHDKDVLQFEEGMAVPLRAKHSLVWKVNGTLLGEGEELFWTPTQSGNYTIDAFEQGGPHVASLRVRVVR
ncbi:MAG: hypothetical protein A2762_04435 [Candidatus Lloydbacteria bacterium RIFCSPHIGHO2_01_FULL_54_11]|nr:MAG: hypothetical protein A2762_04435 [Candidatus Lloydbacteria bacterium RIFCSPHIGHO2_01_FULL_54_11]OGZ16028.1 MAG: hypothetical protein A3H76_00675 [Candidatus Lloydbacteria bacterium RIFCSPLOWO2_02_FULL_54_12]